jgi:hypothetical protein
MMLIQAPSDMVEKVFMDGVDITNVCHQVDTAVNVAIVYDWEGFPAPPVKPIRFVREGGRPRSRAMVGDLKVVLSEAGRKAVVA